MPSALTKPIYKNTIRFWGDAGTPADVFRRRRAQMETMRRLGTPILVKHRFNVEDLEKGIAERSPNFDTIYDQSGHKDPLSNGVGYVSVERAKEEWIVPGNEREAPTLAVGEAKAGYKAAPLYRGYGPGYLTYAILPDRPVDIWKLTEEGALLRTQQARIQLPWWPVLGDNDLLILVELNATEQVIQTFERYSLKQVTAQTMRGGNAHDRWGRHEINSTLTASSNRLQVGQYCEAALIPVTEPEYNVEVDR